ncbi:MAG: hypothetical protein U9Q34_02335, partial [Elusimicrobiota bacterium]|nr:hypothetical protein [Elusimicrobiota bacterium]
KKPSSSSALYDPQLQDIAYSVNYKSSDESFGESSGETGAVDASRGYKSKQKQKLTKKNMGQNTHLAGMAGESVRGIKGKYTGKAKGFSNFSLSIANKDARDDELSFLKNSVNNATISKTRNSKKGNLSTMKVSDADNTTTKSDSSPERKRVSLDDNKVDELTKKMKNYIKDAEEIKACLLTPRRPQTNHIGRGGLLCWVTPTGKRVFQFDDGMPTCIRCYVGER